MHKGYDVGKLFYFLQAPLNMDESKRPIDHLRDAGKSAEIGTSDDKSALVDVFSIKETMYFIKELGIYTYQLADSIDPERTNPTIPDVQQKLFNYGSTSPLVVKTLLTAKGLLRKDFLLESIDYEEALLLSIAALKDLLVMHELALAFDADEKAAIDEFQRQKMQKETLLLPCIIDAESRCKSFIQKAEHVLQSLLNIVRLFYGSKATAIWFESLAILAAEKYGKNDMFAQFMRTVLPFLKFVRHNRHCIEHPKPSQKIIVSNFCLNAKGEISLPKIEIIHAKTPQKAISISYFMAALTEHLADVFELMIAFLCNKNVRNMAGFQVYVSDLPENFQISRKGVRFGYGTYINDGRFIPYG